MDECNAKQERQIGHIPSELEHLNKALADLEGGLENLATVLTPVLRSSTPSPACGQAEAEARSDCHLASEIAGCRRTTERLAGTIRDLKDRLEV